MEVARYVVTFFYLTAMGNECSKDMVFRAHGPDDAMKKGALYCRHNCPSVLENMTGWAISQRDDTPVHVQPHHRGTMMDMLI
jgi:hypothetical protein